MLTLLGICTIAALLTLILFRITSVLVALTLVPIAAALIGGFGWQVGTFAMEGIRSVTPVAALLAFAIVFFAVMNDAGLFEPVIRALTRTVGTDPVRIAVATAAIAAISHLDGAGASTFMVTVPAMLPLYKRAGMSPLTLTCTTALAAGTMNVLPWAGPATRAAAALHMSVAQLFVPLIPALLAGLTGVCLCAIHAGRRERRRLGAVAAAVATSEPVAINKWISDGTTGGPELRRLTPRWYFNALLTAVTLAVLFTEILPLALVFMIASAIALAVNHPDADTQRERLTKHGAAAMMMVTVVYAAGVFTGVLTRSGMLAAMTNDLVAVLPDALLRHLPVLMAVLSMPLSLVFDPDSFYFGLLPIVAHAAEAAGASAGDVARAALLGQMTTGFPVSPLTPAAFLLVGLANVDFADHQRLTIPYAFAVTVFMTLAALATGAIAL